MDDLKSSIIKKVLQIELKNINQGFSKTKAEMIEELERIIIEEVDLNEAN